ncbi:MAG: hypothetical protein AB1635_12355 [Acidobacteriota bacterium]
MSTTSFARFDRAFANVTAASAGGAPFLLAYGGTLLAVGLLGFSQSHRITALLTLFQGNLALPLAFWLERRLGVERLAADNPLRPLSVQLAISQLFALPAAVLGYVLAPWTVPAMVAFIAAAHLLPYAWLQRTRAYIGVSALVSAGALALALTLRDASGPWVLLLMGAVYWGAAAWVHRHAARLTALERHAHVSEAA